MPIKRGINLAVLFLMCSACATNNAPIMTDEKFDSRLTDSGQTEFVYGIAWQNVAQESRQRSASLNANPSSKDNRFSDTRNDRLAIQANNQEKLDLEDRAALALKQKLQQENLCVDGYEISDVFWKNQSMRLLGFCL